MLAIMHHPPSFILFLIQIHQRQKVTIFIITNLVKVLEKVVLDISAVYGVLVL